MEFESLRTFFQGRLQEEMPGEMAHQLMLPRLVNGSGIRFNHKDEARKGGVLILFYETEGTIRFPLIERADYDGIHSGQISLPGGKAEEGDSDLVETALREAEEEIGIERGMVEVVGSLSQFFVGASNYDILPVIGFLDKQPTFSPDPREVKEVISPAAMDLVDPSNRRTKDITVQNGYVLSSPYFDLQEKVVWGATAMMLSELSALLTEFQDR